MTKKQIDDNEDDAGEMDINDIPESEDADKTGIDDDIAALAKELDDDETKEADPVSSETPDTKPKKPTPPGGYLRNKDLLPVIREARAAGYMTDKLARMLMLLCDRYATHFKYSGYSYNDDMRSYALLMLVRSWKGFNPDKGSNPFAYYTQCIKNSFKQYLNYEKRARRAKDETLIRYGLNPSSAYLGEEGFEGGENGEGGTGDDHY